MTILFYMVFDFEVGNVNQLSLIVTVCLKIVYTQDLKNIYMCIHVGIIAETPMTRPK